MISRETSAIMREPPSKLLSDPDMKAVVGRLGQHQPGADANVTATSDCIQQLFSRLGCEDIGELIAEAVEGELINEEQGRWFLGVAVWSGETNGGDLRPTLERWLDEAHDSLRVGLSLGQDTFPFRNLAEMTRVLTGVMNRYPQHAARCRQLIENRRQQGV